MLLLASTSPRRRELIARLGLPFECLDPGLDDQAEERLARGVAPGAPARDVVLRLAVAKALAALPRAAPGRVVVAADTGVVLDDVVLGKAKDEAEARDMLERLGGRDHEAITGLAVVLASGVLRTGVGRSVVTLRDDRGLREAYLASGAWRGKAGAYGLQDPLLRPLIASMTGSESNVVGLPLELLSGMLARG